MSVNLPEYTPTQTCLTTSLMKFDKSVSKISHILTFPLISMSVPMKFHLSKMKTEGLVRKSLRSVKTLKIISFLGRVGKLVTSCCFLCR